MGESAVGSHRAPNVLRLHVLSPLVTREKARVQSVVDLISSPALLVSNQT